MSWTSSLKNFLVGPLLGCIRRRVGITGLPPHLNGPHCQRLRQTGNEGLFSRPFLSAQPEDVCDGHVSLPQVTSGPIVALSTLMNTPVVSTTFVDTPVALSSLVDHLLALKSDSPSIYMDIEGVNLSRDGSISIITILTEPSRHVYLVDVHTLGPLAFDTKSESGRTLLDVLEAENIPKVFFDVRNDSDALYAHFGVKLQGVEDVQLMENASRSNGRRRLLNGLARCISYSIPIEDRLGWLIAKRRGENLFRPEQRGSFEVFNTRPLSTHMMSYCVGDVQFLPGLRKRYWGKLSFVWKARVTGATKERIAASQMASFRQNGGALGPWPDKRLSRSGHRAYVANVMK